MKKPYGNDEQYRLTFSEKQAVLMTQKKKHAKKTKRSRRSRDGFPVFLIYIYSRRLTIQSSTVAETVITHA